MLATAANAEGYYIYGEIESDWSGNEYDGSELKTRVGYEHDLMKTPASMSCPQIALRTAKMPTLVYVEVGATPC